MLGYNRLSPAGKGRILSFHAGTNFTLKKGEGKWKREL